MDVSNWPSVRAWFEDLGFVDVANPRDRARGLHLMRHPDFPDDDLIRVYEQRRWGSPMRKAQALVNHKFSPCLDDRVLSRMMSSTPSRRF